MIKSTLFIFMLLGIPWEGISKVDPKNCNWMAQRLNQTPPRTNLLTHRNWHLLPVGRCGKQKYPPTFVSTRIRGGYDVRNPYAFPWMARAGFDGANLAQTGGKWSISCGGSIINERYILTAAHCCDYMRVGTSLWYLGSNALAEEYFTVGIEEIFRHGEYYNCTVNGELEFIKNDICLTRTNRKIQFSDRVQPICLPIRYGRETENGTEMEIMGFGKLEPNFTQPFKLQYKTVLMMSQDECREEVSGGVDAREICTTAGFCFGDSGGPLMKWFPEDRGTIYYLYGVLSMLAKDCRQNISTAARVTEYMQWLVDWIEP